MFEYAQILGDVVAGWQHVDDEREVDGEVHAEAESADGHADKEAVEVARDGYHEQRQAVDDSCGEDEDLPAASPIRELAADQRRGDEDAGLGQCAEKYLLRYLGLSAADLLEQVVGLVGDQEGIGQDEHQAASESPGEVWALPRIDVESAGELPQRPGRLVRLRELAIVQRGREEQDEEPADRTRGQEHGQLVAREKFDDEGSGH